MKTLLLLIMSIFGSSPATLGVTVSDYKTVTWQENTYAYEHYVVKNIDDLSLIPNYDAHLAVATIQQDRNCMAAFSGGFYAQDNQPLGLVLIDNTQVSRERTSQLFNGFLAVDSLGVPQISQAYPSEARIILQSGPILLKSSDPVKLSLARDKSARRMAAATNQNELIFLAVFNPQAETLGPYLADLPQIVQAISVQENLGIQNAINLDGGRASAFYSPSLALPESDPVGSVFCVK